MDCHEADWLMMKYMDNTLSEAEAMRLGAHVDNCAACKASFSMYDSILTGFSGLEIINAPPDFEKCVMSRVMALPAKINYASENMMCLIWGAVSVLFGIGFMASINRQAIIEYFYSNPELAPFADILTRVEAYTLLLANSLTTLANELMSLTVSYVSASRYILLVVLSVLAVLQYFIYQRNKVKV